MSPKKDYTKNYPLWKQLWLKIPALRRERIFQDFLRRLPKDRWDEIIADLNAPSCSDDLCMCFNADGSSADTCETLARRRILIRDGLLDEWGHHKGDPAFGTEPKPMAGFEASVHAGVNDHDWQHGHKNSPIVEDLGLPTVAEGIAHHGKDYLVLPDGRHGPRRFRNKAEKLEYLKKTGHREKGSYTH